jgi:hypothetical protein
MHKIMKDGSFDKVLRECQVVRRIINSGGTLEDVIVALHAVKNAQQKTIQGLSRICPDKYKTADGIEMIWRCPDNLVPNIKPIFNDPAFPLRDEG